MSYGNYLRLLVASDVLSNDAAMVLKTEHDRAVEAAYLRGQADALSETQRAITDAHTAASVAAEKVEKKG